MSASRIPAELRDEEAVEAPTTREAQWAAIGRHARKNGVALRTILTKNPDLDEHIRRGWEEQDHKATAPRKAPRRPQAKPFTTDLFGNKLSTKGRR